MPRKAGGKRVRDFIDFTESRLEVPPTLWVLRVGEKEEKLRNVETRSNPKFPAVNHEYTDS
jgi:hypothetical protein